MTGLSSVPVELLQHITSSLPLQDVLALRLTDRAVSAKVTDKRFEQCFAERTCDLSTRSLEALSAIAAHPTLGSVVQKITLVTAITDEVASKRIVETGYKSIGRTPKRPTIDVKCTDAEVAAAQEALDTLQETKADRERLRSSGNDLAILTDVFTRLGKLVTLSLEAGVFTGGGRQGRRHASAAGNWYGVTDRKCLWTMAAHDFSIVLQAMVRARICVEDMLVYQGGWGCSVMSVEIGSLVAKMPKADLEATLSSLKSLSISITHDSLETLGEDRKNSKVDWSWLADDEIAQRFALVLSTARGLERLDIRHVRGHYYAKVRENLDFFRTIANKAAASQLRSLTLRGFGARQSDLLCLLRKSPGLEELELNEVALRTGKWSPVFHHLEHQKHQLRQLTMFRCYEESLVQITRPAGAGVDTEPWVAPHESVHTRTWRMSGQQVRAGVECTRVAEKWGGSINTDRWIEWHRREYRF
ncbi:hypothetical protein SLS56_004249 [Neofusicoccum ribis]|uniref:Putative f-box domain protein n=1 Tax=Neofusicoccum ribis TaxID=45134 RepID=A0A343JZS1_9PEZI|nr:putative f-box domain protein [Neofusicoccum ribis]